MNWDPLHDLVALRDRATRRPSQPDSSWTPAVDLLETETAFIIVVELPGLDAHEFSISASGDSLVLSGQRPAVTPPPDRYLRMERGRGRFSRTFAFGDPIDVTGIHARFERGLLTITVPRQGSAADRRISIG